MDKIELEIIALSHSVSQSQSYAVVLGEKNGNRRLPVVIGAFEAQAIAVALENMKPSRPLTHDLFKNVTETLNAQVEAIVINNLIDGIFYAQLIINHRNETLEIDSRTSDALALAVRFNCPIYTYEFIMQNAGVILEEDIQSEDESSEQSNIEKEEVYVAGEETEPEDDDDLSKFSLTELNKILNKALENEDYEKAARVRDEINNKKKNQ